MKRYFKKWFNYKLKMSEYLPMYNLWFVGAIVGNILVALGSILKTLVWYQVGVVHRPAYPIKGTLS